MPSKKKPCKGCKKKEPIKNDLYRSFILYQSSNKLSPGEMQCWANFILALNKEGNIPYLTIQSGTPNCIPSPGHPCPKT